MPKATAVTTAPTTAIITKFHANREITNPTLGTLWTSGIGLLCRSVNMMDNAVDMADRTIAYANTTNEQWIDEALATREVKLQAALDLLNNQ